MIEIAKDVSIREEEISFEFIRSSGPGGQNVNKVATAVRLLFNVFESPLLTSNVRERLKSIAGKRLGEDGILRIHAQRFRTQEANRKDAMDRLISLLHKALEEPRVRQRTYPSRSVRERRLKDKRRIAETKEKRRRPEMEE
ncbi:MAG: aminoacyl-tRNA hydrolase [Desulfobacteraceae bacterium]|jgi:ribosome-associated protein|nr:MAG: aminoacyl-tRNA hydrolase [Desulfobacteraceae bacterium]